MNTDIRTLGWIGLGDQGAPMARAVSEAGIELHVWVRRDASLTALAGLPFVVHDELAGLASATDAVALCLREDSDITDVALTGGLLAAMSPGSILVNHGTGLPDYAASLAAQAADRAVMALDAPVSGGHPGAVAKTLTAIVGGDSGAVERMRPIFQTYSAKVAHMGGPGTGQTGKLINNALLMMNQQNVQLALRLAQRLELDIPQLIDLLLSSTASSFALAALGGAVTVDNADHLAELQIIDMDLFDEALQALGTADPEISARARRGAHDLPDAARLATAHTLVS